MFIIGYSTSCGAIYTWKSCDPQDAYAMQCALMLLNLPFRVFEQGRECLLVDSVIGDPYGR
jgi:hypothetical protein